MRKVEVALWRDSNQGDICWYPAVAQGNGVYAIKGKVVNHKLHFGVYRAQAYVTLKNGLRIPAGIQSGTIEGSEAQIRISNHVNDVYDQVGHDLYACYKWVVDNVSYKKLPIPVEPKEGYTADQKGKLPWRLVVMARMAGWKSPKMALHIFAIQICRTKRLDIISICSRQIVLLSNMCDR